MATHAPDIPCDASELAVLLVGGFGHASSVFDEWARNEAPFQLAAAVRTLADEPLDGVLAHPWAQRHAATVHESVEAALAASPARLAVVSTRPGMIAPSLMSVLDAGLDAIAEKPLATDPQALRALFALARCRGRRILAMLSMRSQSAFVRAREWVAQGRIGEPMLVNARKSYKWGRRPAWFGDRAAYGGTWPWVGIHALDMATFITGLWPTSVTAHHANRAHPDFPGCEDVCAGVFTLSNGGLLDVSVDLLRPATAPTHGDDFCRVVGTEGILEANASAGWCRLTTRDGQPVEQPCGADRGTLYASALRFASDPQAGLDETTLAFRLTDAVLQARESADTGRTLAIDGAQWQMGAT